MVRFLGIDMGAETIKVAELLGTPGAWEPGRRILREHRKDPVACLSDLLAGLDWDSVQGAAVTGRLGRQVRLARVPTRQALAAGVRLVHGEGPVTVVSIGSRGFAVLELRGPGREWFRENGRCAQGTGNFLQQLAGRFGLEVGEAGRLAEPVRDPARLSGRCPVILKTDLTHLANRGEPRERLLAGLLDALAENVLALLRPGTSPARILLAGGVARCARVRARFRDFAERHGMVLAEGDAEAGLFLESLGAAWLAADQSAGTVPLEALAQAPAAAGIDILPPLSAALGRVRRLQAPPADPGGQGPLVLGFDMGSTGSKAVAFDPAAGGPAWEGYLPTNGAPVQAAQALMRGFLASPAAARPLRGFGVTGSGREIVGSLLSVCFGSASVWVLNEIAAHAAGALAWDPRVDTLFEIGGQDAKFIRLEGGRVVDAALNEACSAGTGSFIEEQGRRFTGLEDVQGLGTAALAAAGCAALGQHCSVFMAEVLDAAVAAGVPRDQILAGIYHSVVANYLNRVKGSRGVGKVIFCQGMPFASDALAAAVAAQTGAEVVVPPRPGLMGALGIAILAARELPWAGAPDLDGARFLEAVVEAKDQFRCRSTRGCGGAGNRCRIDRIATRVGGQCRRFTWGGGCSLWDRGAAARKLPDLAPDPFRARRECLAGLAGALATPRGRPRVALAGALQLEGLLPFYATYLHGLGFDLVLGAPPARETLRRGIEAAAIPFCAPVQQYHGIVAELAEARPDFIFLPMIRELPRVDGEPHSVVCPMAQGAPDLLRAALPPGIRLLSPVLDMGPGWLDSPGFLEGCRRLAADLGPDALGRWRSAWHAARAAQAAFEARLLELGREALAFCREHRLIAVAVAGRGYTIHDDVLNANVPALVREQGAIAIPIDCLPLAPETPAFDEVYWGQSQRILRAAWHIRRAEGLYGLFCSNYSCGPDSFTAHFFAGLMEGKPFALIETDGHAGDAGTKTRIEAFLHCVREHQRRPGGAAAPPDGHLRPERRSFLDAAAGGETVLIPSMGPEALAAAAVFRGFGIRAEALPPADPAGLAAGRRQTSGKECLPLTLTLGSLLQRVQAEPAGRFLFLMPSSCGPCRLGAYRTFDRMVLQRLGLQDRVRIWSPPWGDYFQGLPPGFAALVLTGVAGIGLLRDALTRIRPAERRPGETERRHRHWQARLLRLLQETAGGDLSAARVLLEVATGRAFGVPRLLRRALGSMARGDSGWPLPRVLLTGEIYVRLEPFANGSVARLLNDRGLRVATESLACLLRYSDYSGRQKGLRRGAGARLESWVRERLVGLCQREAVRCLGSPPEPPVREVLGGAAPYLRDALEGEAVLSVGGSLRAWRQGEIEGAVLSGPLECMPDKLAECQLALARDREGLPSLALAMTGEPPDPDLLDNFAFELHRRHREGAGRRAS